jgi:hypothetical protein
LMMTLYYLSFVFLIVAIVSALTMSKESQLRKMPLVKLYNIP